MGTAVDDNDVGINFAFSTYLAPSIFAPISRNFFVEILDSRKFSNRDSIRFDKIRERFIYSVRRGYRRSSYRNSYEFVTSYDEKSWKFV